jgi:TetR/AcrR family transcriptional repressor of nem operon
MAEHRERILKSAARRFRKKGFDGVSVADLMKEAGLTHGGFYNHFRSKEELIALAAGRAFDQTAARWNDLPFEGIVRTYLSAGHYREPENGCAVAAIGAEAARLGVDIRSSMSEGIQALLAILETRVSGRTKQERRKRAITALSGMVGAMVLARCSGSKTGAEEFLNTVSDSLISTNKERTKP